MQNTYPGFTFWKYRKLSKYSIPYTLIRQFVRPFLWRPKNLKWFTENPEVVLVVYEDKESKQLHDSVKLYIPIVENTSIS